MDCEANPGTLTQEKAALLRGGGGEPAVHRSAILPRRHAAGWGGGIRRPTRARARPWRARRDSNISDWISSMGFPGSAGESFEADVDAALALAPEHVSCYCLEIEEGTPLARAAAAGELATDEDEQRRSVRACALPADGCGTAALRNIQFARPGMRMPAQPAVLERRGLHRHRSGGALALERCPVGPHGGTAGMETGVRGKARTGGKGAKRLVMGFGAPPVGGGRNSGRRRDSITTTCAGRTSPGWRRRAPDGGTGPDPAGGRGAVCQRRGVCRAGVGRVRRPGRTAGRTRRRGRSAPRPRRRQSSRPRRG